MKALRFSIVVPTYRRPERLRRCLDAIVLTDYPRDAFEVLVVSDEVSALTEEIVCGYQTAIPVFLVSQSHLGPASARNAGAARAQGEFLIFLDDDSAPAPDWLRQWELYTCRYPDHAAGGRTVNALSGNIYCSASQALLDYILDYFNAGEPGLRPFILSDNLCVPAAAFHALGGFSAAFPLAAAEDRDFCDRWCAAGGVISRAEQPACLHAHELSLIGFWQQHWNYGCGAHRLHQTRDARGESTRIEPLGFYVNLLRFPWTRERPGRALLLSVLLCVSQIANAAGFLKERLRNRH
jgi:glycosyltransferase involved in cell wall biosynthesis